MRFRLSTLMLVVILAAFACITFLQWRYIDTLAVELQNERARVKQLQTALVAVNQQVVNVQNSVANQTVAKPVSAK